MTAIMLVEIFVISDRRCNKMSKVSNICIVIAKMFAKILVKNKAAVNLREFISSAPLSLSFLDINSENCCSNLVDIPQMTRHR